MSVGGIVALGVTLVPVIGALIGVGIWVGGVDAVAQDNRSKVTQIQKVIIEQAIVREQIKGIRKDLRDEKDASTAAAKKLDRILMEVTKR